MMQDDTVEIDALLQQPKTEVKEEPPKRRKRRGKTGQISEQSQQDLHDLVTPAVSVCQSLLFPPRYHLRTEEIDGIFQPLERIILRHTAISEMGNPDYRDAAIALYFMFGYMARTGIIDGPIFGGKRTTKKPEPQPIQEANPGGSISPNPPNNATGQNGQYSQDFLSRFELLHSSITRNS